ncbi:MAG: uracil-DNA glycosylase [Arcticibacterium sp.]|jgi:uracil-DNA glycosylase
MAIKMDSSWKNALKGEFDQTYFIELSKFVKTEYANFKCYPPAKLVFNAFDRCPYDDVKVVILGQDPYHGPNQAHGLCFSVNDGVPFPPSLRNIFKELKDNLNKDIPNTGNLEAWANQGVLLLNATLTVRSGQAGSHQKKGWETFTDAIIDKLNKDKEGLVFMLWGNYAQKKGKFIDEEKHLVLKAKHPSPLSANFGGWFGQQHFSKGNDYLIQKGHQAIRW